MRAISALSIINNDFYCQIERIMRFYGSQLIAVFRSFRSEVLSGSDKLATSEMTGLIDPLACEFR
jgi:hypothetical protein